MGLFDLLSGNEEKNLQIGDWVEVIDGGEEGEIVDIIGNEYLVNIEDEGYEDTYTADQLRKIC